MRVPGLCAWIEEGYGLACLWIDCLNGGGFGFVAKTARHPQIFLSVGAATGQWDDVLDGERNPTDYLLCPAIAAAVSRLSGDARPEPAGFLTHRIWGSSSTAGG